jgi:hypothetical protein
LSVCDMISVAFEFILMENETESGWKMQKAWHTTNQTRKMAFQMWKIPVRERDTALYYVSID